MANKNNNKICKTCRHWKKEQSLLNYNSYNGICTNAKNKFNITNGRTIGVVDRQNPSNVTGLSSHDFETISKNHDVQHSRYLLQTSEQFGCINHE